MIRLIGILVLSWVMALRLQAAEIVLVYPRTDDSTQSFVYADQLDTTFILGHLIPADGKLVVNDQPVITTKRGAFLAWLPIRKAKDQKNWDLTLRDGKETIATLSFPYLFESERHKSPVIDTFKAGFFPHTIRVTTANAHSRTCIGGSYHLFPDSGCDLKAIGHRSGFFEFEAAPDLNGFIEDRFVAITDDRIISEPRVGNGKCTLENGASVCRFAVNCPLNWTTELSSDAREMRITILSAKAAIDRIYYSVKDGFLEDILWEQLPTGLMLQFRCKGPIHRGFQVTNNNGEFSVLIPHPFAKRERTLKGKIIVLDPGHGGSADGAIGPLGTKEKDITLKWSGILTQELKRRGAIIKTTRSDDRDLDLYDRVEFGISQNADIFLSLHCNALPDGVNPLERTGCGTYYYQEGSRTAAEFIHRSVLKTTRLRDDGLYDANFAVIRPTAFPAVLLEAAYLIHPEEEELLQSDEFLRTLSSGIVRGLQEYFQENR